MSDRYCDICHGERAKRAGATSFRHRDDMSLCDHCAWQLAFKALRGGVELPQEEWA